MTHITYTVLVGFHLLFAALFVGGNAFLDFLLSPRLDLLPPGQAARLGEKLGMDFALYSWGALVGLFVTGTIVAAHLGVLGQLTDIAFWGTEYGRGLVVMIGGWLVMIVSATVLTFYLRPRVVVKLPHNATREDTTAKRDDAVRYAKYMSWLARFNAVGSFALVFVGTFLSKNGGF